MPARPAAPGEAAVDSNIKLAKLRERLLKVNPVYRSTGNRARSTSCSGNMHASITHFMFAGAHYGAGQHP